MSVSETENPAFPAESTEEMVAAINQVMPFGKYAGTKLLDLPEYYLVWFKQRGFAGGKLGTQMALVYEIKLNGLDKVFRPLLRNHGDKRHGDKRHGDKRHGDKRHGDNGYGDNGHADDRRPEIQPSTDSGSDRDSGSGTGGSMDPEQT